MRTGEDEVEQLPRRSGAGEDGRTEGEEKTVDALEVGAGTSPSSSSSSFSSSPSSSSFFHFLLSSPVGNARKGFGYLFMF